MFKYIKKSVRLFWINGKRKASSNNFSRAELGKDGEAFVALALQSKGYRILDCNYRRKCGEVDIVAQKDDLVIFVEVKSRLRKYFHLSGVVNHSKQKKIILTAKHYVLQNNISDKILRFDIALIEKKNDKYDLNYIENAFTENNE